MSTDLAISATTAPDMPGSQVKWKNILVAVILFVIVIVTIGGNVIVLLAFGLEKKLRNTFTLYVANLAFTDLMVGSVAMLFYTFDTVLGYWPFGQFMCGIWIFFDYAMTFASVFTLVAISFDRFWAVKASMSYKVHNTKKKAIIMLGIVWFAVIGIWLPPFILDRVERSQPGICWWDPAMNTEFVYVIAIIGHHFPCLIIIHCYICVLFITRRKLKLGPKSNQVTTLSVTPSFSPSLSETVSGNVDSRQRSLASKPEDRAPVIKESTRVTERKIFITLTYILVTYLICWVPFHIIFDLSFLKPELISNNVYTFGFWIAYFNSTLNPLVYTYSNSEFRKAFKRVLTGYYFSRH